MIDYRVFDTLKLIDEILGKQSNYTASAVSEGKLKKIEIVFDTVKDNHGVTTLVKHGINFNWIK